MRRPMSLCAKLSYEERQKDASYVTVSSRPTPDSEPRARIVKSVSLRAAIGEGRIVRLNNKPGAAVKPGVFEVNKFFRGLSFKKQARYSSRTLRLASSRSRLKRGFTTLAAPAADRVAAEDAMIAVSFQRFRFFFFDGDALRNPSGHGQPQVLLQTLDLSLAPALHPAQLLVHLRVALTGQTFLLRGGEEETDCQKLLFGSEGVRSLRFSELVYVLEDRNSSCYRDATENLPSREIVSDLNVQRVPGRSPTWPDTQLANHPPGRSPTWPVTHLAARLLTSCRVAGLLQQQLVLVGLQLLELALVLPLQLLHRLPVSALHGPQAAAAGGLGAAAAPHASTPPPSSSSSSSSSLQLLQLLPHASLAGWLEGRDDISGKELISFNGMRSNSAHFLSISSSVRGLWFEPPLVPLLDSTASHWLLVFLSSCHWLCSLPWPSAASL
ncbi:hypothetical protein EYF80_031311 [Liparis tanakae]|uniref:Uncharacterized protein n=1 Tax=Liparis tanakae TaxID=230148 RepID=A0A4Z2GY25_9TELE|nr:hypothetical protein EYF80_031311 [Liparis tanakae]